MTEPKITREVAEQEVSRWAEALGADLGLDAREYVVRSVMDGRLIFDDKAEAFALSLRRPVKLDNGETVATLKIAEPTGAALVEAGRGKNDIDQGMRLVAAVSGLPLGVVERFGQRDVNAAGAVLRFFA